MTTPTPNNGSNIIIDPRIYDISRNLSIRGIIDALIELITNSYDAYNSAQPPTPGSVFIFSDPANRKIRVFDTAKGISASDFNKKILTVGSETADLKSRGLMGRGLKDITAIATVAIKTVCNGVYSSATLTPQLTFENVNIGITPPPNTAYDRTPLSGGSFFFVELEVKKSITFLDDATILKRLRDNICIRTEERNQLFFNGELVKFTVIGDATKKLVSSFKIIIPQYPECKDCKLTIYKYAPNLLAKCKEVHYDLSVERKDYAYHGIEVVSSSTAFEVTDCSVGTWSSSGYSSYKHIRGKLEVPYIDTLARELFSVGSTESNPFLIFDPNRRDGLNKRHPFIKALYTEAGKWVRHVLRTMSSSDDEKVVESETLRNILNTLSDSVFESIALTDQKVYTWESKRTTEDLKEFEKNLHDIEYIDDSLKFGGDSTNILIPPNPTKQPLVEVESDTLVKPHVKFEIVTERDMEYSYRIKYEGSNVIVYLNSLDPALSNYIKFTDSVSNQEVSSMSIMDYSVEEEGEDPEYKPPNKVKATIETSEPAYATLGMSIKEAIVEIHVRNLLLSGNYASTTDDLNSVNELKKEAYDTFRPQISSLFGRIRNTSAAAAGGSSGAGSATTGAAISII